MTTIRQLIQASPAKTNELFAKLVDTSEAAVKTRDRLLSELKVEIEHQAKLQEQHLFPVLKKHKETKDLVAEALDDTKETQKLLSELERTPKDSKEFAAKVADLRKVFQQHVRDEKKELLPAILKALSDEEADAVVEKIEDGKAKLEGARQAEADERRAEAKREREAVKTAEQALENTAKTVRAGAEGAHERARAAQNLGRGGLNAAADMAKRGAEQFTKLSSDVTRQAQESTEQTAQNMQIMTQSGTVLSSGYQDVSREWLAMSQARLQKNLDGLNAMMLSRSLPELISAQSSLIRDNIELTIANSQRLAKLSAGVADKASRTFEKQKETSAGQKKRAA